MNKLYSRFKERLNSETLGPEEADLNYYARLSYDGDTDTGYFGTLAASEVFTGTELAELVGLNSGTVFNNEVDWLGFYVGPNATCNKEGGNPYLLFVPQKPLRHSLAWSDIDEAGVARGDVKTVTKSGHTYKVRLISGGNTRLGESNYDNVSDYDHPVRSEWNQLLYRVHQTVPNGTNSDTPRYANLTGGAQAGDNWANFTDAELGVNSHVSPNGSASWCMGDWYAKSSYHVSRGYLSVASVSAKTHSGGYTHHGWRPALVRILDKPI